MERVKWTHKIKNAVVFERVGEGRIKLELIKKWIRNWLGHWLRRNREESLLQKKISDDMWTVGRYEKKG